MTSHALDPPPPVTNCHTFSDPIPLEHDVLYGRPLTRTIDHYHTGGTAPCYRALLCVT